MAEKNTYKTVSTWIMCILISIALMYTVLITSFEIGAYSDFDYYEGLYEKYNVVEPLQMEMKDVMDVTEQMMAYLRGDRETLIIDTIVNGEEREFFNEREISHMEDVRDMFVGGLEQRLTCVVGIIVFMGVLILGKFNWKTTLPKAFVGTMIAFLLIGGIVGVLFATNFNYWFTVFHTIFFEGDTWLFDPNTSLMINMLPEGFFYDMTARIVIIFISGMAILSVGAIILLKKLGNSINTTYK